MTNQSKLQTELSSVDVLNDVNTDAISEAALQSVYSVIETPIATDENSENVMLVTITESIVLDSPAEAKVTASAAIFYQDRAAFEYTTDDPESYTAETLSEGITYDDALVDPIFSIMPVDEAIVIDGSQPDLSDEAVSGDVGSDDTVSGEAGEVVDDVLSEDMGDDALVDPIFSIMPVDEAIVIDGSQPDLSDKTASGDVGSDDTVSGEAGEAGEVVDDVLSEDMGDDALVDPIMSIMPVIIGDLITEPSDELAVDNLDGGVEGVVDTVDLEPEIVPVTEEGLIEPIALIRPLIFDWSYEENGDISLDNLAVLAPDQTLASTWMVTNLTAEEMVSSAEESTPDTVTDVVLLGVPELVEFVA
ncbi:MAG: hypothetical protein PHR16_02225 [Methylovulum sp.]|nr:hypothetical protein [Methylovulum sp.]